MGSRLMSHATKYIPMAANEYVSAVKNVFRNYPPSRNANAYSRHGRYVNYPRRPDDVRVANRRNWYIR